VASHSELESTTYIFLAVLRVIDHPTSFFLVVSPMPVPTWTGKTYALTAVEMGSRMGFGELLATETDADEALKAIVLRLERESQRKLNKIRTDTGNAYLREAVDAFCTINYILHNIQPRTEENGATARTSKTYLQKVSTMLEQAKMDTPY
jgi:hypothetical protein